MLFILSVTKAKIHTNNQKLMFPTSAKVSVILNVVSFPLKQNQEVLISPLYDRHKYTLLGVYAHAKAFPPSQHNLLLMVRLPPT